MSTKGVGCAVAGLGMGVPRIVQTPCFRLVAVCDVVADKVAQDHPTLWAGS